MDITGLRLELDVHTHTIASGHAYGTLREMAAAAAERGLKLLGSSDHAPGIPGTCDPLYFRNLEVIPKVLSGVEIAQGCEINILNGGLLSLDHKTMGLLDYRIAGIHPICYTVGDVEQNTLDTVRAIRSGLLDAVVHPDDGAIPLDYRRVVEAARDCHTLLELNNNAVRSGDRRKNGLENYRTMLSLCSALEVPILISSDAHDPSDVGNFSAALEFLSTVDFPEELIINTSVARFRAFVTENHARVWGQQ